MTQAVVRKRFPSEQERSRGSSTPVLTTLAAEPPLCCGTYSQLGLTDNITSLIALGDKKERLRSFLHI